MQSSDPITVGELYKVLSSRAVPRNVLIRGKPGVGKSTLAKHIANQWAEEQLWKDFVNFLFLVTMRDLSHDKKFSLWDFLLEGLPMSVEEQQVVMHQIRKKSDTVMIILEGIDELTGYHYDGHVNRDCCEKMSLNLVITSILSDAMLPGAKVLVTTRPYEELPRGVFDREVELYGFTEDSIKDYVRKFSASDRDLAQFILEYLDQNVNMMTFCYVPVQCSFVCRWLKDIHSRNQSTQEPAVNTMTQLYIYAMTELLRKLFLKSTVTHMDRAQILHESNDLLTKYIELAKRCTITPRLRIVFFEDDLSDFSDKERNCGFLTESLATDQITRYGRRRCWSFTHLTIQEFMAAIGMLRGPREDIQKLIDDKRYVWQHEVLLTFMAGLLGDPMNAEFMRRPGVDTALDCRTYIEKLTTKTDALKLVTLVYESQLPSLVDIVPTTIRSAKVWSTEMMSLSWVLKQPACRITCLRSVTPSG